MEIRQLESHEFEQAIQLADVTFREEGHKSMGVAFPHVFSKEMHQSFGAFDGSKLVSFIGLVPSIIKIGSAEINAFSIGAVSTDMEYRKRGISSAILQEIYRYIDKAQASILFISGDRGMYLRNQCHYFGQNYQITINKDNIKQNTHKGVVRKAVPGDLFQLNDIRNEMPVRFHSNIWEWSNLLATSGFTSIYKMEQSLWVRECDGKIDGYVVVGLPNEKSTKDEAIVTEWRGNPEAVHEIIAYLLRSNLATDIEMSIPWQEKAYIDQFNHYPKEMTYNDGTMYLVNANRFLQQVRPYLAEQDVELAKQIQINQTDHESYTLTNGDIAVQVTLEELVRILFSFDKNNPFESIFPIPLPHTNGVYYV